MDEERDQTAKAFKAAVNMTPNELERWLDTPSSKAVGSVKGRPKRVSAGGESVGHASGRRILRLKQTGAADLTDGDYRHMRKVVGYVRRHLAQRPEGDVADTRWRRSLMNWGHDPMKKA